MAPENGAHLADHARHVAMDEDHQRAVQIAFQAAAGLLHQPRHVVAEERAGGLRSFFAHHLGRDQRAEIADVGGALLDQLDAPLAQQHLGVDDIDPSSMACCSSPAAKAADSSRVSFLATSPL